MGLIMKEFGGYKEDRRKNSLNLLGSSKEALGLSMCANCATKARNVKCIETVLTRYVKREPEP